MNNYTITPENLNDMFCHACAALVIIEPLIEHKDKSALAFGKMSRKYFNKNIKIWAKCEVENQTLQKEILFLTQIKETCEQLIQAIYNLPEGNIEIPLDHALEIVYYSKQYEIMRGKYNALACNRNGKELR